MNRHLEAVPTLPRLLAQPGLFEPADGKVVAGRLSPRRLHACMTKGERHGDVGLDIGRKRCSRSTILFRPRAGENKPFFVWYAPMMHHDPHTPPERLLAKYTPRLPLCTWRNTGRWWSG